MEKLRELDKQLQSYQAEIKNIETLGVGDTPHPKGGGGTAFSPVFRHLAKEGMSSDCLIYLTDGYTGDFADEEPKFPVMFGLICDNPSFKPPFGETFRFDMNS